MIYFNVCWDPCAKLEILLADFYLPIGLIFEKK